ncbi:MAG TPA: hypothetical protein VFG14_08510 [Chthoniobacteraceae bacterium]|nr:hypothetical protein [Chthoniobacteraceae bacterium]
MHRRTILALLLGTCLSATAATPDEIARFLAGLPMHGTSLEKTATHPQWVRHAMEFDDAWKKLETKQLSKLRAWAPDALAPQFEKRGNVFYFFSGPDFLYAQALWPNAENYVLVAREPVGILPDPEKMPPDQIAPALENLRKTLNAVLSFSFFITQDMKTDLNHQQLNGTLPVILLFASRAGCKIESVEFIGLDKSGALTSDKPATRGVKVACFGPQGRPQNIYYFEADLGDWVLNKNDAVLKFCTSLGRGSHLLKAASYLMHEGGFEIVRDYVMQNCDLLVEDDSGVPWRYFDRNKWQLRLCGRYPGPIDIFKQHFQADLADAYSRSTPLPMGFSFGYRWIPSESGLLLARPRGD